MGPQAHDPFAARLGIAVEVEGPGRARASAVVSEWVTNQHGTAHGGFVYTLADAAFAAASNSHGPRAVALVTAMHYVAAPPPGSRLVALAEEEHLGRRTALYRIPVRTEDGRLVALFTGTVFRVAEDSDQKAGERAR